MGLRQSVGRHVAIGSAVVLVLCLLLTGTAYGQTPASDQYGTKVAGVEVGAESTTQAATAADALPNTGLSLLGAVAIGGILVMTGVAIRRRERRHG
jgi:hypothetical protein